MGVEKKILTEARAFEEQNLCLTFPPVKPKKKSRKWSTKSLVLKALTLGLKEFVHKSGFKKVHLGLSGGVDSSLTAALAVHALGNENVHAIFLPGPFTSKQSAIDAQLLSQNLKIPLDSIDIISNYEKIIATLKEPFNLNKFNITHENIQARIRGMILMAYSNQYNSLLLNTANKSEMAVGYSTLYGDLCGAIAPLGDLYKTEVYEICHEINKESQGSIPLSIIERPPSAELRPEQKDTDSLPPYHILDPLIEKFIVEEKSPADDPKEQEVWRKCQAAEFKRRQSPPVLRISEKAFGTGRVFPVANFNIQNIFKQ